MAVTEFGTNSAQNVNIWSKLTMREALKATLIKKFLGTSKRAIFQRITDLEKSAGDTIKFDLLMQMTGAGVSGDNTMRGNEEALTYHQDTIVIDQLRNAHAFKRMSQQRTIHDMRVDAKTNLADWHAGKLDSYAFRYLCGDTSISHGQTGQAADQTHRINSGDVARTSSITTDEAALGTNDQITLADIDYAKESAKTLTPPIRPTIIDGEEYYVVVLHPYSVTDLRLNVAGSSYITWPDIQMYANKRGLTNPIFSGALGVYNKCILYESSRIFNSTGNVRRNLFLGAQAGVFAIGNAYDKVGQRGAGSNNLMSWYEKMDDYGNEKGIAVGLIFGMKKVRFNSLDYGAICISSYAATHAA